MKFPVFFWIGILLFAISFFLVAVAGTPLNFGFPGYMCASSTLAAPWDPTSSFDSRTELVCCLLCGWINLAFLTSAILSYWNRHPRLALIFKILTILMIPSSWAVMRYQDVHPREGCFLWILGILLTLFSRNIAKSLGATSEVARRTPA